ncbi:MAG: non-reducing end alpha-L-arabinofuranosidase family hydrolase [Roseimicrobium sp.]
MRNHWLALCACLAVSSVAVGQDCWSNGQFQWNASAPLIDVKAQRELLDPHVALKDPTIVYHEGRWHLFGTLRKKSGTVCMQYLSFADWAEANTVSRQEISFTDMYHCAPQVFYFTPHQCWYLIYQLANPEHEPAMGPHFSTNATLADAKSWTNPQLMVTNPAPDQRWIDFWVICDAQKAHLFYTSNNGQMWRRETKLADFPHGWSEQMLALSGDIFEASHTYKLKGRSEFLTIIEAQGGGRRYYKAYLADRLEGPWRGLADTVAKPFAALENTVQALPWTASISHGELLRTGIDERMEAAPAKLRFLFQGVNAEDYRGSKYGGIPWSLGLLEQTP